MYDAYSDAATLDKASSLLIYALNGEPLLSQSPARRATLSDGIVVRQTDDLGDLVAGSSRCSQSVDQAMLPLLMVLVLAFVILVVAIVFKVVYLKHSSASINKTHVVI